MASNGEMGNGRGSTPIERWAQKVFELLVTPAIIALVILAWQIHGRLAAMDTKFDQIMTRDFPRLDRRIEDHEGRIRILETNKIRDR